AVQGIDGHGAAQNRHVKIDGYGCPQVVAVALEAIMGEDVHAQVEIAGGAAAGPRLPLASQADARAGPDAGRNTGLDLATAFVLQRTGGAVKGFFQRNLYLML